MNHYAIQHIVDSSYCFPVSPNEIVLRLRTAKDDVVQAKVKYESKYVIGVSHKTMDMRKTYQTEWFDYFEIKLKLVDTRLAYVFYVNDGTDWYYFSEDGITKEYNYKLGFYNFFQYPFINENDIMHQVSWMKTAVFYQIFVDRFNIGNDKKDKSYINLKWGDIPNPKSFAGGDLKGITKKLDYIKSIGCNAIYLTPVFKSISNHKYDISDYYNVDAMFGNNEDLMELVDEAHKKNMHIVLDAVFNHCSDQLAQFQDVIKNGKASKYYDWFVIYGDRVDQEKMNYETFAACNYMPKFNTANPKVQDYLLDIATYYIDNYHIDGWRLDVADEISHEFWRAFRKRVKQANPDAVILGENWHDSYSNLRGDQYDGIMNYSFTKLCLDYLAWNKKDAKAAADKLNEILMRNTDIVNSMMMNLLDSHDTHRFFKETDCDRFKMKAALSLLYLFPGAPCIFYGTEILTYGGFDPDCRRCMDWDKAKPEGEYKDIYQLLTLLSELRTKKSLADGKISIYEKSGVLIVDNEITEEIVSLKINNTKDERNVDFCNLKPYSFDISVNGGSVFHE